MGVVFFAAAVLAVLAGSAGLLILGIVLRFATKKRAQAGGRWAVRMRKLSFPAIIIGAVGVALPLIFAAFVLALGAVPPGDYVETGIIIEESGYQSERFTADGVTYLCLPFAAANGHGEPVFTYKEEGWYTASQWGNYFRVENGIGCDLVCSRHFDLFCPEDQFERVVAAYESSRETGSIWRAYLSDEIEVSEELRSAFRAVQALEGEGRELKPADGDDYSHLLISEYSFDGVVDYENFVLLYLPDGVCLQRIELDEKGIPHIYAVPVPVQYQPALLELEDAFPIKDT